MSHSPSVGWLGIDGESQQSCLYLWLVRGAQRRNSLQRYQGAFTTGRRSRASMFLCSGVGETNFHVRCAKRGITFSGTARPSASCGKIRPIALIVLRTKLWLTLSAFVLMPTLGLREAFAKRGLDPNRATALDMYAIACNFGVGQATLVNHLAYGISMIN